ncbi:hypothetical protein FFF93_004985 [Arthrobacter sp. KBS0702]|uniref:SRPBCC family protein n=1 Tax=Arthrobacter sp. KBS0702 TaxID=2578107 RepID=UPI00110F0561|nr:SRPBCC family protein [Arthrobacter sp. KBS0702]QDW29191.1 hypothetical protein FFF93_004985 [Arthrobacter sp. KBS0702]
MKQTTDWPAGFEPATARVYAYNELHTQLSPEQLWPVLIEAEAWPSWYRNARDVVLDGGGSRLDGASRFSWTTFGLRVASTVREFEPCRRLGWEGAGRGSTGYHRWDLQRTADGGTLIVTEEVQGGIIARLLGPLVKRSIEKQHQHWLEALVQTAGSRAPRS